METNGKIHISVGRWTLVFLAVWGGGQVLLVGSVALGLHLRMQTLLFPYLLLLWSGYIAAVLTYWARQVYPCAKSYARRFAIALFGFLNLYLCVLVFSAYRIGLLPLDAAVHDYGPYILPVAMLASVAAYVTARQLLAAYQRGRT